MLMAGTSVKGCMTSNAFVIGPPRLKGALSVLGDTHVPISAFTDEPAGP